MTQLRKCESCRARKLKCDEQKPQCGRCSKGDRRCIYRFSAPWIFMPAKVQRNNALHESSTLEALPLAEVQDRPFSRPVSPKCQMMTIPPPMSLSSEEATCTQWVTIIKPNSPVASSLQIFGTWVNAIPLHIGTSSTLDFAAIRLLDTFKAYTCTTTDNEKKLHASSIRAMKSLRKVLKDCQEEHRCPTGDILLSIQLHFAAEVLSGIGTYFFVLHLLQLTKLMQLCGPQQVDAHLAKWVLESIHFDEAIISIMRGQDSRFDLVTSWMSPNDPFELASAGVMKNFIRIPHLIRLTRQCLIDPSDAIAALEATSLAYKLYQNDCQPWASRTLDERAHLIPSSLHHLASIIPESYHFTSVQAYDLALRYYTHRIMICGAIQNLKRVIPTANLPGLDEVELEELEAAAYITMCTEYAMSLDTVLPAAELRFLKPLQFTFGVWHRLVQNGAKHGKEQTSRAKIMKTWCTEITNDIHRRWKCPPENERQMEATVEGFAGGVLLGFISERVYSGLILST
ncbi:hypothetical protein F5884DRAFT_442366 [Xylogone sp. PMI_703]|nr:hypothetical protein F5884DRAFT_442366 [Xylogone sp. PMI_703]